MDSKSILHKYASMLNDVDPCPRPISRDMEKVAFSIKPALTAMKNFAGKASKKVVDGVGNYITRSNAFKGLKSGVDPAQFSDDAYQILQKHKIQVPKGTHMDAVGRQMVDKLSPSMLRPFNWPAAGLTAVAPYGLYKAYDAGASAEKAKKDWSKAKAALLAYAAGTATMPVLNKLKENPDVGKALFQVANTFTGNDPQSQAIMSMIGNQLGAGGNSGQMDFTSI